MKIRTLLAVSALGLAGASAHAQGLVLTPVSVQPDFSATLTGLTGDAAVNIFARDAGSGAAYAAGQFGFSGGVFQILNLTNAIPDPSSGFADPTYNIASDVTFTNLLLNETFSSGATQLVTLYDASGTPTDALDTGTLFLESQPLAPGGGALRSATLTGRFDTGDRPNPNGSVNIRVASVPEPGALPLLAVGLGLVAPALRARLRRRA